MVVKLVAQQHDDGIPITQGSAHPSKSLIKKEFREGHHYAISQWSRPALISADTKKYYCHCTIISTQYPLSSLRK